jgi:uncharacterized OsmC-like protein
MSNTTVCNGVDVDRLKETMSAIKSDPDIAQFTFRAHNRWVSGGHCRTKIKDFHGAGHEDATRAQSFVLVADEPEVLLGEDNGPNATEAVLHALAACLNASFIYNAAAQGVAIEELELEMEGNLDLHGFLGMDPNVRNGFEQINVMFKVKSDAPREKIAELVELAQQRSPVFDVVTHPVPVDVDFVMK